VHRHAPATFSGSPALAVALCLALVTLACGGAGNASPSPNLVPTSNPPAGSPGSPQTPGQPTPTSLVPFWPAGWDRAFCEMFGQLVETQELAVDIGRALEDGDRADARALTAELAASATLARELLGAMPEWRADEMLRQDVAALLDLADEMALRYDRHLNQGRRPALAAAREAGAQMKPAVDLIIDRLVLLGDEGLACPGLDFQLEAPSEQ
jgi:hypothetical protein